MTQHSIFGQVLSSVPREHYSHRDVSTYRPHGTDGPAGKLTGFAEFRIPSGSADRLVAKNDPECIGAELLRTLASRLNQAQGLHPLKKLLVTSTVQGEGKTVIAANLSITLSLHHKRVLLVDGDLRSSNLSKLFDIVDDSFIETWYEHDIYRVPLLRKAAGLSLWVLPAGAPFKMPGSILQSREFAEALTEIEHDFDWIIIDSPPLIPFGDAGTLAALADAVLLVTRSGVTPKIMLEEGLRAIDKKKIIATILNGADVRSQRYYHDYYGGRERPLLGRGSGSKSMC